jgi:uncharacterized protein (TIGR00251 family)
MKEIKERKGGKVGFRVRVQPSAPQNELLGWNAAGELRIRIAARPQEGAANRKLISFLATFFAVPRGDIQIVSGDSHRVKIISAPGMIRNALLEIPDE